MSDTLTRRQHWVFDRSRDPAWLWGAVIAILSIGLLGGWIAERYAAAADSELLRDALRAPLPLELPDAWTGNPESDAAAAAIHAAWDEPADVAEALEVVAYAAPMLTPPRAAESRAAIAAAGLDEATTRVALLLFDAVVAGASEPPAELGSLADGEPPAAYASYAIGLCYEAQGRPAEALPAFEREAARPDAPAARQRVVALARQLQDVERLIRLQADPLYAEYFDARAKLDTAVATRDWLRVVTLIPASQYEGVEPSRVALAGFAGLAWFLILLQLVQPPSAWSGRVALCVAGFLLGVLSIVLTLLIILVEERLYGFVPRNDLAGGLVYHLAGVALREEAAKLALFLPLVPILLRRGSQLEMLLVAGCVGLGFAAEENVNYFLGSGGAVHAPARFLTANFAHIAMTGLIGLSFCRVFIYGREGVVHFAQTFAGVVVLHGLYNAVQSLPDLLDLAFASFFCLVALAFWFFREVRNLRVAGRDTLSPIATFVVGLSLVVSVTFILLSAQLGLRLSIESFAPALIELALVAYLFLREMPGSLVTV